MALPHSSLEVDPLRVSNTCKLTTPLHVLVGSARARKLVDDLRCHVSSGRFPTGSFIQVDPESAAEGPQLMVSSPELCFTQLATELPFIELVRLGFEFCGSYRLDKQSEPERGFRSDLPLTTIKSLRSFLDKTRGLKGHVNAQKALRFIADGSASPMETVLTMLLTLPYRLGGYGFSMPQLNYRIEVDIKTRRTRGRTRYYGDLYWPLEQIDVEYDSDAFHATSEQIAQDAVRRNALASAGVSMLTVSRKQIMNTVAMHEFAEVLSKLLEKRLQYPMPDFISRRYVLRAQLLSKRPITEAS